MKKNKIVSSILISAVAASVILPGCDLISINNEEDMSQVIATVDITASESLDSELKNYKDAIEPTDIYKRELISYFYNVGSTYVSYYGYSYAETFELLVNSLVNTAIVTQYATLYLINESQNPEAFINAQGETEIDTQIAKYESLLTPSEIKVVKYTYWSTLNDTLDSYEEEYLDDDDEEERGTDTRTTPTNVDTEVEDFYPALKNDGDNILVPNYNVYTGFEGYQLTDSGDYQENGKLDGTNRTTRLRAYNAFVNSLKNNYLIEDNEDISELLELKYVKTEYLSQLKSAVVEKFYDVREAKLEEQIKTGDESYIQNRYDELFLQQKASYSTATAFESAMSSMSDSSFILYSPDTTEDTEDGKGTFGFVYNILLPFSTEQSRQLTELQNVRDSKIAGTARENEYYFARNKLLKQIQTEDQRSAWFNGETEYAFNAKEKGVTDYYGVSDYLFFENNMVTNDRYESLSTYAGTYSYNGKVIKNADGTYSLKPNKLDIDGMLTEFSAYINYVTGFNVDYDINPAYYNTNDFYTTDEEGEDVVDYSKLVYASGKVGVETLDSTTRKELFMNDSENGKVSNLYKTMSAVNELQYAYTTDTSVLSQYVGYSVSAYDTSYIKEFEYAAQTAVKDGAGSFSVCAGDYGWHLIYVTYTFDPNGGNVYAPDWDNNIDVKGTFENLFFEYIMSTDLSDAETGYRSSIIELLTDDYTVVTYQNTYQDLLDLDNE